MGFGLRGFSIVLLDDATEHVAAAEGASGSRCEAWIKHPIPHANSPMRSAGVVVVDPASYNVVQLARGKDEEVVEALALELADNGLDEGIRLRRVIREPLRSQAGGLPELSEVQAEPGIPSMRIMVAVTPIFSSHMATLRLTAARRSHSVPWSRRVMPSAS
jgi:hypothetical protein